jgi:hypothetical protein
MTIAVAAGTASPRSRKMKSESGRRALATFTEAQAKQIFERGIERGRVLVLEMSGNLFDLDPTLNRSTAAVVEVHKDKWFARALSDLLPLNVDPGA